MSLLPYKTSHRNDYSSKHINKIKQQWVTEIVSSPKQTSKTMKVST